MDFEVYHKVDKPDGSYKLVTKGKYTSAEDRKIGFRWGMYCGSKKGRSVARDAMLFVTGARFKQSAP